MEIEKLLDQQKKEIVEEVARHIEEVTRHVDVIKEDFDGKVQLIAEQYGSIQDNIVEIKTDVKHIRDALIKKVDYEEFESLEKRVAILEAKIAHR